MNCLVCNKETKGNIKYCSEAHHQEFWRLKSKKTFSKKNCVICGNEFMPVSSVNKYCSSHCKYVAELKGRSKKNGLKVCKNCNNTFEPYTSLDKFCSANCRIENQKNKRSFNWNNEKAKKITGENNPAYRNGHYVRGRKQTAIGERTFKKNLKVIKDDMLLQHGYIFCQHCKTNNSLRFEGHHIIYRSEKPLHEYLHDERNIILLCIKCHNEFHRHKSIRNEIVKERGLDGLFNINT